MSDNALPPLSPASPAHPARRVRLRPEVRRRQILDAALAEFSAVGFEGATMDRIAQRTGLTKAGLYAHFKSKEHVLEALLVSNIFDQSSHPHWQWTDGATLEETIDRYLGSVYRFIRDPRVQATFRLLIAESGRAPERIRRWNEAIFRPHAAQRQRELDECVARGLVPDNAVSRKFSLASAPALQALMAWLLLDARQAEQEEAEIRAAHREMLLALLGGQGAP
ncbi:TetR/AcrR family transcriptional regulator [Orrella sp. JC864]|uniref:TetR/AcrR family transcriptional regulator n=1 Tax=Orrella sp. JC864 TaxID=3120298 RepID=UPI00300BAEB3